MKIEIYCDGSCRGNPGPGGWAICIVKNNEIVKKESGSSKYTTNNIMEMMAVIYAINYAKDFLNIEEEKLVVYTDSAYIQKCWSESWWKKWVYNGWLNSKKEPVANKELWEQMIPYFKKSNFSIEKVKGHSTNFYNNLVDQMAVKESKNE